MSLDFHNIMKLLMGSEYNLDKIKNGAGDNNSDYTDTEVEEALTEDTGKTIKETSIWDEDDNEKYNQNLLEKDKFIETLYDDESMNAYTKEDLGKIYDLVSAMDGAENLSEEELAELASFGGGKDNLSTKDVETFLDLAQAVAGLEEMSETEKDSSEETISSSIVMKDDDRILTDEDGNKYVNVESWSSDDSSNNCLSRIINNSYDLESMGIELYSSEYYELEKLVMDANPEIYGTEDSGWRQEIGGTGRSSAVVYTNDKIILPDLEETSETTEEDKNNDTEENSDS